ncbi:hypothetical protein K438DRAFT_1760751 [Mycena galopus ATCC 62051]|nr:hypothetical protein K438DRAFT_1760751 [Mycena galopus ATCC 62051]
MFDTRRAGPRKLYQGMVQKIGFLRPKFGLFLVQNWVFESKIWQPPVRILGFRGVWPRSGEIFSVKSIFGPPSYCQIWEANRNYPENGRGHGPKSENLRTILWWSFPGPRRAAVPDPEKVTSPMYLVKLQQNTRVGPLDQELSSAIPHRGCLDIKCHVQQFPISKP